MHRPAHSDVAYIVDSQLVYVRFFSFFIEVLLLNSVVLVSGYIKVIQIYIVIYRYSSSDSFPL